jgi:hypothetical protein
MGLAAVGIACAACTFDASGEAAAGSPGDDGAADDDANSGADAGPAQADATPPTRAGVADSSGAAIVLDGDFADWDAIPSYGFAMATADHVHRPHASYVPSASVLFKTAHDAQFLYFAIVVQDDVLIEVPEDPSPTYNIYNDDSVSLYIDAAGDAAGPYGVDDKELVLSSTGYVAQYPSTTPLSPTVQIDGAVSKTDTGYAFEIGIDKATLGVAVLPTSLGFSLAVNDDDGHGTDSYDAIGVWSWDDSAPCPTCCGSAEHADAWCDTTTLGRLNLK